jgi:transposase-like protein
MHYPRSFGELQAWFRSDEDCLDYLAWLRWPSGFVCPGCGHPGGWPLSDGRFECSGCHRRTSVTAGTIFDRTRTPLTVWFAACWLLTSGKDGISALSLQRTLEIGSYQTAWAMLHRLRCALVRPGRDRLSGTVEVDETYIGGEEPGLRGGRARGKKVLTGVAVEVFEPKGMGRCRLAPLNDASAATLRGFLADHVAPGATVITDGWSGYRGLEQLGYVHEPRNQRAAVARGQDPGELLPGVHRIASLVKRWLLGTTRAPWMPPTCPATSTSSRSASTAAALAAAGWCSTARSNWPSATRPCATTSSSLTPTLAHSPRSRRPTEGIPQAWTVPTPTSPGGHYPSRFTPVKWRARWHLLRRRLCARQ